MLGLLVFFLFLPGLLAALLDNLGDLDVDLVGSLLEFEILSELLLDSGKILVRHLRVGVGIDLDALSLEEVHKVVEPYVELSYDLI